MSRFLLLFLFIAIVISSLACHRGGNWYRRRNVEVGAAAAAQAIFLFTGEQLKIEEAVL